MFFVYEQGEFELYLVCIPSYTTIYCVFINSFFLSLYLLKMGYKALSLIMAD
jgi:hypothetical protein